MPSRPVGHRDVLDVALPMILANVTVPLVGIADSAAVGHLDQPDSLAGVAVGATLFSVLFTALNFLRMGTTGLAAQAHGAGDTAAERRTLVQGLVVAFGLAASILLLSGVLKTIGLALIAPAPAVATEALAYINTRLWGAPATLALFVLTGWFIGRGDARSPLLIVLTVNAVNIALDFVLVWHFGLAARGVALATVTAEYLGLALGLVLAARAVGGLLAGTGATPALSYRDYLALNLPLLLRTVALMFVFAFLTAQGARFGTLVLAANALLMNFLYFASFALDGFANAAESLVGRALGARDRERLQRSIRLATQWSLGVAVVLAALFAAGGLLAIRLMTSQAELQQVALAYLPWLVVAPLIGCWAFLYDGIFVGATLMRQMRDSMLIAVFVVYLPVWWLLRPFGNHGLWIAFLAFLGARGAVQWWMLERARRKGQLLPA